MPFKKKILFSVLPKFWGWDRCPLGPQFRLPFMVSEEELKVAHQTSILSVQRQSRPHILSVFRSNSPAFCLSKRSRPRIIFRENHCSYIALGLCCIEVRRVVEYLKRNLYPLAYMFTYKDVFIVGLKIAVFRFGFGNL